MVVLFTTSLSKNRFLSASTWLTITSFFDQRTWLVGEAKPFTVNLHKYVLITHLRDRLHQLRHNEHKRGAWPAVLTTLIGAVCDVTLAQQSIWNTAFYWAIHPVCTVLWIKVTSHRLLFFSGSHSCDSKKLDLFLVFLLHFLWSQFNKKRGADTKSTNPCIVEFIRAWFCL